MRKHHPLIISTKLDMWGGDGKIIITCCCCCCCFWWNVQPQENFLCVAHGAFVMFLVTEEEDWHAKHPRAERSKASIMCLRCSVRHHTPYSHTHFFSTPCCFFKCTYDTRAFHSALCKIFTVIVLYVLPRAGCRSNNLNPMRVTVKLFMCYFLKKSLFIVYIFVFI